MTEKEIFERWPRIFPSQPDNTTPGTSCMFWGLDVPDSWLPVIDALCETLQGFTDNYFMHSHEGTPSRYGQMVAEQVKEKYGGLRFYYGVVDNPEGPTLYGETERMADGAIALAATLIERLEAQDAAG